VGRVQPQRQSPARRVEARFGVDDAALANRVDRPAMSFADSVDSPPTAAGLSADFALHHSPRFGRVLVLDEHPEARRFASRVLCLAGHSVHTATDVHDACRAVRDTEVDLAVVALRPGAGIGPRAVAMLLAARRDLPVIVLGAADACDLVVTAIRHGVRAFVREPFTAERLAEAVAHALEERSPPEPMPADRPQPAALADLWAEVDAAAAPAYALDADGCVRYVNESFAALLGTTREELVGAHFSRLVHEPDLPRARWRFNERRIGDRATANVPLRLRRVPAEDGEDNAPVAVLLSAAGRYGESTKRGTAARFLGTVGTAQATSEPTVAVPARRGVASRAAFMQDLAGAVALAREQRSPLALVVVNVDRFKLVNDSFGHLAGDRLLKETAARLRQTIGEGALLTRLGGDEFATLLRAPHSGAEARLVARRMLEALRRPVLFDDEPYVASASLGLALFPEHGGDARVLLRAADRAMREAKRRGGDQVQTYSPAIECGQATQADLERDLRVGLQRDELEVRYQPIHDLDSGRVDSLEALVRWRHPALGLLEPARFIHIAEESGLVRALGTRVLESACAELRRWRDRGFERLRVSVNLSARDFERDDCVEVIADTLARHSLPPDALEIEVTEHSLLAAGDAAARAAELRRHGVQLSIDDFGTKYSSLAYLQRLPVSTIKVDRAFVREVGYSNAADSIVQALIGIARAMGLRLVAEGVEEIEQVRWLRHLGCHLMQGYLFSHPLPSTAIERYLARSAR
jgi:diguanylate cyclase (GGDEF)-like protein/PAS domain S-box-containing protein